MDLSLACEECGAVFTATREDVDTLDAGLDLFCRDCGGYLFIVEGEPTPPPGPPAITARCAHCGTVHEIAPEGALAFVVCAGTEYGLCECGGRLDVLEAEGAVTR